MAPNRHAVALAGMLAVVALVALALGWRARTAVEVEPQADVAAFDWAAMAEVADAGRFARPAPGHVTLPRDFSPHANVRADAWSLRGVLRDATGALLVLDVLAVRAGLAGTAPADGGSLWAARAGWVARVRLGSEGSDVFVAERAQRESALGLAGAAAGAHGFDVAGVRLEATSATGFTLAASVGGMTLRLRATATKPLVAGDAGGPLKAFSFTRLEIAGHLDGTRLDGDGWFERAWGELPLPGGATRVERLALQLDDGDELQLTRTQRRGSKRVRTRAVLFDASGSARGFDRGVELVREQSGWRILVPAISLHAALRPIDAGGAGLLGVRATVELSGTRDGREIDGIGFAEFDGDPNPTS